ncbi:tyrosine-type recombinase/integrase [Sphingobium sp. SYK-6]|uniref:tyrosine-type recombinase/integrase n=1 Tax=Sphingobium sp. (strain NBRC 103272 / SYK-6) TaxID=627192 RepID=UPI0009FCC4D7|nr:site-specific integrase [Sphingobium sp. SYK-6]
MKNNVKNSDKIDNCVTAPRRRFSAQRSVNDRSPRAQKQRRSTHPPLSAFGRDGHRKYLTRAETHRFLASAQRRPLPVHLFCWFIAATGCRISEALSITPKSLDFEAKLAIVESLKKRRTGIYRAIPLPANLLEALSQWIEKTEFSPDDRLWPWSRMTAYRRIKEVMEAANIIGLWATPKGLRHGFGVRAVQSSVPLHLVQRWLGHADMKTTAIYAAAMGPEEREIASRIWLHEEQGSDMPPEEETEDESMEWNAPDAALQQDAENGTPGFPFRKISALRWVKRLMTQLTTIPAC